MEGRRVNKSIPPLFKCPISLDLFTDPVTLCTGQTYDRPSIQKWISEGNFTCPVTMQRLHDLTMVPNLTLSHMIKLWLDHSAHNTQFPVLSDDRRSCFAELKQTLESKEPIWEKKLQALKQVKNLTFDLPPQTEDLSLVNFGFFRVLINLAFEATTRQRLELVELALSSAVKLLPFTDVMWLIEFLKKESNFAALLILLEHGTSLIKIFICDILEVSLSSMMIASAEIQRSVINLTLSSIDDDDDTAKKLSEAGVKVISAICSNSEEQALECLVKLGAIEGLIRHILRGLDSECAAVAALEALVEVEGGKEAVLREVDGVKAVVKMVFRVNDHEGSESALSILVGLCGCSAAARADAVKEGVLTQLLLLMQSQCSPQAKAKATALLRMLGDVWYPHQPLKRE